MGRAFLSVDDLARKLTWAASAKQRGDLASIPKPLMHSAYVPEYAALSVAGVCMDSLPEDADCQRLVI